MKLINIIKIIFIIMLSIIFIQETFAITKDITFHNKFEKNETNSYTIKVGFPAYNFTTTKVSNKFVKDEREKEYEFTDYKREYNKKRREENLYTETLNVENLYSFEKNYQRTEYSKYKKSNEEKNSEKINLFTQNRITFTSSESYSKNDFY